MTASVTGCSSSSRAGAISGRLVTDDRMRFSAGFRCGLGLAVPGLVVQPTSARAAARGPAGPPAAVPASRQDRRPASRRSQRAAARGAGCAAGGAAWPSARGGPRALPGDLGGADLGAGVAHGLLGREATGPMPSPRRRSGRRSSCGSPSHTPSAAYTLGSRAAAAAGVAGRRGVEAVLAEHLVRALGELGSQQVAERDRATAGLDDGDGLGCGEVPAPAPADEPQRLRDRLDGAEVGAGGHDHLGAQRRAAAARSTRGGARRWPC